MSRVLTGSFLMALAVSPHLKRPGGRIINISSIAAFTGAAGPVQLHMLLQRPVFTD
ncbi:MULTISPECIES: hypothetical protein [Bacillus]|uniref:hypothetical protein n=1 Tax=Bacillus TaxID=1386 RepID=UPI0021536FFB|nr:MULTISPECIES: hypothetical protein [Bacillus]